MLIREEKIRYINVEILSIDKKGKSVTVRIRSHDQKLDDTINTLLVGDHLNLTDTVRVEIEI